MPWQPAAFLITATIISLPSLPAHAEPLSNSEYDRIMKEVDEQPGKQFIDGILGDIACGVACKPLGRLEPVCSIICGGITNIDWDKIPNPFVNQQPPKNSSDTSQVIHLDPVYIQVNPESKNAQHQPD
ncbi:MAG TPA: hypothetical protein DC064_15075, partial [Cyanobacteria bacterium UBA9273]|nr:hypothetical protein [Cyanobacteria bacterium UBA9273]